MEVSLQVDEMVASSGQEHSPLIEKQADMNEMFRTVKVTARDKQNQLHDTLKQVGSERKVGGMRILQLNLP